MDYLNYYPFKNYKSFFLAPDSLIDHEYIDIRTFLRYKYPISYKFNSRGFRDDEWPDDLKDVIWCLGDSYTLGVGIPKEHTWPSILQSSSTSKCLNLGIHGASNELLRNIALQILLTFNPKNMVIMWSFFHRRHKDPWKLIHYDRDTSQDDNNNFLECFNEVNSNTDCNILNLLIPPQKLKLPTSNLVSNIHTDIPMIDIGRDGMHFDYLTSSWIVDKILPELA